MKSFIISILIFLVIVPLSFAYDPKPDEVDQYRPYLFEINKGKHPGLSPYGRYETSLFQGAATYEVAFEVPPGTNKLAPSVLLTYNSHLTSSKPDIVGTGWTLMQSMIVRDVNFTPLDPSDDKFILYLNGSKHNLVYVESEGRYHTKKESYLYIKKETGGENTKLEYWVVKNKNGMIYRFGYHNHSELVSNKHDYVIRWSLDTVTDNHNSNIYYSYLENPFPNDQGTVYPEKIEYNNDKKRLIEFVYEDTDRPDIWFTCNNGNNEKITRRLHEVVVKAGNNLIRKYALEYCTFNTSQARTALSRVVLIGNDDVSTRTYSEFNYAEPDEIGWERERDEFDVCFGITSIDNDGFWVWDDGTRFADVNRDGLVDVLLNGDSTRINTAGSWVETGFESSLGFSTLLGLGSRDTGTRVAEVNGDGLPDIIYRYYVDAGDSSYHRQGVALNTGHGWERVDFDLPATFIKRPNNDGEYSQDYGVRIADVNGDGLSDIIKASRTDGDYSRSVYLNTGQGWEQAGEIFSDPPVDFVEIPPSHYSYASQDYGIRIVDINGDGLPDIIRSYSVDNRGGNRGVYINTGSGWEVSDDFSDPPVYFVLLPSSSDSYASKDYGVRFADVNGDGLNDIIKSYDGDPLLYLNTGSGWERCTTAILNFPSFTVDKLTYWARDNGTRLVDVNGDGAVDIIHACDGSSGVWLNKSKHPFYLIKAVNSAGGITEISYKTSTSFINNGDDDIGDLNYNLWVVKDILKNNNVTGPHNVKSKHEYTYANGKHNFVEKEFRGFGYVEDILPDKSINKFWFHQDEARYGMIYKEELAGSNFNLFSRTENTYSETELNGFYISQLIFSKKSQYDGSLIKPFVTSTELLYDDYGNTTQIIHHGDLSIVGDEKTEHFVYKYDLDKWIVNRKTRYYLGNSDNQKIKESFFIYDELGDLREEEKWLSDGVNPKVSYAYDSFGNLQLAIDARMEPTQYFYDDTGTFPVKERNPKNQETLTSYDFGTGNVLSKTDPNGFTTSYIYDIFGKLIKEVKPYDTATLPTREIIYQLDGIPPESIIEKRRENSSGTYDSYFYYDGFGKLIQKKTESETSGQFTTQDYLYNSRDKVEKVANPYFTTAFSYSEPVADTSGTFYYYDSEMRPINLVNPDNTLKRVEYDRQGVSLFDENDHRTDFIMDAYNQIIKVEEYNCDEVYSTTYDYDMVGNLTKITDSQKSEIQYEYDTLGRRTGMHDPVLHDWSYSYDRNGNLLERQDANGNILNMTYDSLNRAVTTISNDTNISYLYDTPTIGTLSSVTTPDIVKTFTYDNRLRLTSEGKTIDTVTFNSSYTYDSMDRVISKTLPDATTIDYSYNNSGRLETIDGVLDNIDYNAHGLKTTENFSNGLTTTYTYETDRARLKAIHTPTVDTIQYDYDNKDNITSISRNNYSCEYEYDCLDRLTSARKNAANLNDTYNFSYSYNSTGDLVEFNENGFSPETFTVVPSADFNGSYSIGTDGNLISGEVDKSGGTDGSGCQSISFNSSFKNFENKSLSICFKRSLYGSFNILLYNETGQYFGFMTNSNDFNANYVTACSALGKCEYSCGSNTGGWRYSDYDWGTPCNDNQWHTLIITKLSDKVVFDLDNGAYTNEIDTAYGCDGNLPISELDFSGNVDLKVNAGNCRWKSDTLSYSVNSIGITGIQSGVGSLCVSMLSSDAVNAGAMWSLDGGEWHPNGTTLENLMAGTHTINFKDVDGWETPDEYSVNVYNGQTSTFSAPYVAVTTGDTGSLQITLEPQEAIDAGAQWSVDGGVTWHNSGDILSGLEVGEHQVTCQVLEGWSRPSDQLVLVVANKIKECFLAYQQNNDFKEILLPDDINFGWSVSIDGNYALVGVPNDDSVYVYYFNGYEWVFDTKLHPKDVSSKDFGWSVSLSGEYALIGAKSDTENHLNPNCGSAYIFKRTGTTWQQVQKLWPTTLKNHANFGESVSIDGSYAVVAGSSTYLKTVYIYQLVGGKWELMDQLIETGFASDVALHGGRLVIGSTLHDEGGRDDVGAVYVYHLNNGVWEPEAMLTISDAEEGLRFGYRVSIYNNHILAADRDNDGIHAFSFDGENWVNEGVLQSTGDVDSLCINRDYAVAGDSRSSFRLYKREADGWCLLNSLGKDSKSVSLSEDFILIGSPYYDTATFMALKPQGSVTVNIDLEASISAGAQWRIDGGDWLESRDVINLTAGEHLLEYKPVYGWNVPTSKNVTVIEGQVLQLEGNYSQSIGSIGVSIEPQEAITAGAQWSIDGGLTWHDSGEVVHDLPLAQYTVQFKDLDTFITPSSQVVYVCKDLNALLLGAYEICGAVFYRDADGDSYGDPDNFINACTQPDGYVVDNTDCNDFDADEHPNQLWYKDFDGDHFSDGTQIVSCVRPENYFLEDELNIDDIDTDDQDGTLYPGALELCDGKDNNQNGEIDEGGVCNLAYLLPDTGLTNFYDNSSLIDGVDPNNDFYGQDANYTRKRSYTKLDILGNDLADDAIEWVMVRDNVTGLIWEVKTDDGSIHDKDNTYTWYDGIVGTAGVGTDTEDFLNALNTYPGFCGYTDWRLPTVTELSRLTDSGEYGPAITGEFFPETNSSYYWSSTICGDCSSSAWRINFYDGYIDHRDMSYGFHVRAVRSEQPRSVVPLIDNGNGTITDPNVGLMWQQAEAGSMSWQNALAYCENLVYPEVGGYSDWRLPDKNELQSLIDYSCIDPFLDKTLFPGVLGSEYWSSTTYVESAHFAWLVPFDNAFVDVGDKSLSYRVRAVRSIKYEFLKNPADLDGDQDGDGYDLAEMARLLSEGNISADELEAFVAAFGTVNYQP